MFKILFKKFIKTHFAKKLKRSLPLLIALLILFFVTYQNFETTQKAHMSSISAVDDINNQEVSPEVLFLESWKLIKENYWDTDSNIQGKKGRANRQKWSYWKKRYLNKIKTYDDTYIAVNTMIASLDDPYSKFLSKNEFKEQSGLIDSKLYGIGINIVSISGKIFISNTLKGAPADLSGIKAGDMIIGVDGQDVRGKSIFLVSQYIKGPKNPVNTSVTLEVLRAGKKITKKIKRKEIKIRTVDYKNLGKNIGYLQISSFISQDTPSEFLGAMEKLNSSDGLILDLRGNTGGLFQNAIFVSNVFLKHGTIVNVVGRSGHLVGYEANKNDFTCSKPLVVLVDGETASAGEIVTGALQDHKRAKIVGTKTFGKGLVQKVYPLPSGTGINLTIAQYYTPNDHQINKKGITPDYEVNFTKDDIAKNSDRQLDFAYDLIRKEINVAP